MEQFYLEKPSISRKIDVLEYMEEHQKCQSDINGAGSFDKVLDGVTYEDCLEKSLKMEDKEYANSINKCPRKTFFLIRKHDNKLIGMISIRYNLTEELLQFVGHIGYGIRPTERGKGYNKINLYLGLIEAQKLGLSRVMLGCSVSNTPSDKTIQALGGILERCEVDPSDNTLSNVYWIDVKKSLYEYRSVYAPYIAIEELELTEM